MTGAGGAKGRWSDDLPGDLLGTIYRHCSSPYDRCRFAAVCCSWRAAASWQPKLSSLPLLLNSTGNSTLDRKARAYSLEDGRVLRAPLPWFPYGKRIVGCYDGGWVAAAIGCRINVEILFTRAWVVIDLPIACGCPTARQTDDEISIEKIVFSKDPASDGCVLAALASGFINNWGTSYIKLYTLRGQCRGWVTLLRWGSPSVTHNLDKPPLACVNKLEDSFNQ
jgi:hypothetical protein